MSSKKSRSKQKKIIALGIAGTAFMCLVLLSYTSYKKYLFLSDPPTGDKACPPITPLTWDEFAEQYQNAVEDASLPWEQHRGYINDASCLNRTPIYGMIKVTDEATVLKAIQFAKKNNLKISLAAIRHSMGGQAFAAGSLVLDMRSFNSIKLNESTKSVLVQSGATWHDIQNTIHPKYAIKSMQSTDIFSVGGSISVNAHGMDHNAGSVARTIKKMRVALADGTIKTVSPTENAELFRLVCGGYGLFGVILDAELEVVDNDIYQTSRQYIAYDQYPDLFNSSILPNANVGLTYAHLSTSPDSFLKEMIVYLYEKKENGGEIAPLQEVGNERLRRFTINFSKQGPVAMRIKWLAEKYLEPRIESCTVQNRNQSMKDGESCLVSRNDPMHDSVLYLRNNLPNDTDILHEYFIPRDQYKVFVDNMRTILQNNQTNLLNASVRIVHKEDIFLTYAPKDMYSVVLYINQKTTPEGNTKMQKVTSELIDLTHSVGGRFFLPYQLYYTKEQLAASYPEIDSFFAEKKKLDPTEIFTNTWYKKYASS